MSSTFELAVEAVANTASDDPKEDNFRAVARAVLSAVRVSTGNPETLWFAATAAIMT